MNLRGARGTLASRVHAAGPKATGVGVVTGGVARGEDEDGDEDVLPVKAALASLQPQDVRVVRKLDGFGHSFVEMTRTIDGLRARAAHGRELHTVGCRRSPGIDPAFRIGGAIPAIGMARLALAWNGLHHGQTDAPSSPAVSGSPQIRFAFCTA